MFKLYFFFVLVACVFLVTEAQLTFTSSWGGKRAMSAMGSMGPIPPCKNDDAMAAIFKMIQNEAQRMILCQKQP